MTSSRDQKAAEKELARKVIGLLGRHVEELGGALSAIEWLDDDDVQRELARIKERREVIDAALDDLENHVSLDAHDAQVTAKEVDALIARGAA